MPDHPSQLLRLPSRQQKTKPESSGVLWCSHRRVSAHQTNRRQRFIMTPRADRLSSSHEPVKDLSVDTEDDLMSPPRHRPLRPNTVESPVPISGSRDLDDRIT